MHMHISYVCVCMYTCTSQIKSVHYCVSGAPKVWELSLVIKQILASQRGDASHMGLSGKDIGQFKNLDFRISSGECLWPLIPHLKAGSEKLRGTSIAVLAQDVERIKGRLEDRSRVALKIKNQLRVLKGRPKAPHPTAWKIIVRRLCDAIDLHMKIRIYYTL